MVVESNFPNRGACGQASIKRTAEPGEAEMGGSVIVEKIAISLINCQSKLFSSCSLV